MERATSSSPVNGAGARPARRGSIGFPRSFAMRRTRRASTSRSSHISYASTRIRAGGARGRAATRAHDAREERGQRPEGQDRSRVRDSGGARAPVRVARRETLIAGEGESMAERIVVGMSGGVDSSVAAALLVEQGYDVVGITMRVWPWAEPSDATKRFARCCGTEAADDARHVARALRIPYYLLNMQPEFEPPAVARFPDPSRPP